MTYALALGGSVEKRLTECLPVGIIRGLLDDDLLVVVRELVDDVLVLLVELEVVKGVYAILRYLGSVKGAKSAAGIQLDWASSNVALVGQCISLPRPRIPTMGESCGRK